MARNCTITFASNILTRTSATRKDHGIAKPSDHVVSQLNRNCRGYSSKQTPPNKVLESMLRCNELAILSRFNGQENMARVLLLSRKANFEVLKGDA